MQNKSCHKIFCELPSWYITYATAYSRFIKFNCFFCETRVIFLRVGKDVFSIYIVYAFTELRLSLGIVAFLSLI